MKVKTDYPSGKKVIFIKPEENLLDVLTRERKKGFMLPEGVHLPHCPANIPKEGAYITLEKMQNKKKEKSKIKIQQPFLI